MLAKLYVFIVQLPGIGFYFCNCLELLKFIFMAHQFTYVMYILFYNTLVLVF